MAVMHDINDLRIIQGLYGHWPEWALPSHPCTRSGQVEQKVMNVCFGSTAKDEKVVLGV